MLSKKVFFFVTLITIGLVVTVVLDLRNHINIKLEESINLAIRRMSLNLSLYMEERIVALKTVRYFLESDEQNFGVNFVTATQSLIADLPGLKTIGYTTNSYTVERYSTLEPNDFLKDFDFRKEPKLFRILNLSITQRDVKISRPYNIPGKGYLLFAFLPIQQGEEKRGVVFGVFSLERLIHLAVLPNLPFRSRFQIKNEKGEILYSSPPELQIDDESDYAILPLRLDPYTWKIYIQKSYIIPMMPHSRYAKAVYFLSFFLIASILYNYFLFYHRASLLQHSHAEIAMLEAKHRQITQIVHRSYEPSKFLNPVGKEFLTLFSVSLELCNIYLAGESDDKLILAESVGKTTYEGEKFIPLSSMLPDERTLLLILDQEISTLIHLKFSTNYTGMFKDYYELGYKTLLILPLRAKKDLLGCIVLASKSENFDFQIRRIETAEGLAINLAFALENVSVIEKLEKANRHKSEFLAKMSHELRTPLNTIIGFSQVIKSDFKDLPDETLSEFSENILAGSRQLLDIINDLLDISRIEAGHLSLSPCILSVQEILIAGIETVKPQAEEKQQQIVLDNQASESNIEADPKRIGQIMENLLSNAVKFSGEGKTIHVNASLVTHPDMYTLVDEPHWLKVSVKDEGIGISQENLDKIFSAFQQVEEGYARQYEGTGLGLALTRRLVEMQGGVIRVQSEKGVGSEFTFFLPLMTTQLDRNRGS